MTLIDFLKYRATNGIGVLSEFHTLISTTSIEEVVRDFGFRLTEIRKYVSAWETFKHHRIIAAARKAQLSLTTLLDLTSPLYPLRKHKNRVNFIAALCKKLAGLSADKAKSLAKKLITQLLGDTTKRPDSACMHKTVGEDGKRRLVAALNAPVAARVDTILSRLAHHIMKHTELDFDQAYAQALTTKIMSNNGQSEQFAPMFMIATDCRFHADGTIATTDGALVDLTEVVNQELAPTGWAAVIGTSDETTIPTVGALVKVDNRFATEPQRLVAIMETLMCAWPGCDMPATKCQAHHIKAHKHGGKTKQTNLTMLCKHHNGKNDDDPGTTCHGRIERDPKTGQPGLRRRPNEALRFNTDPVTEKGTAAYIQYNYYAA